MIHIKIPLQHLFSSSKDKVKPMTKFTKMYMVSNSPHANNSA